MDFEWKEEKHHFKVEELIDQGLFVSKVLGKIFFYNDECGICYENFADVNTGAPHYLNCQCNLGYHKHCLVNALEHNNSCPQCRRRGPGIVEFKGNIQDLGTYEDFFDKAMKVLDSQQKLQFISLWFEPVRDKVNSLKRSCLVNPFDYEEFTIYKGEGIEDCTLYKDRQLLCINKIDKPKFKPGDQTINNRQKWEEEWLKVTKGIFMDPAWSWDNVIAAGGMVSKTLSRGTEYYPESSDIDLFIYGKEPREREDAVRRIVKFFAGHGAWYLVTKSIVDILVPGKPHTFQLICGNCSNVEDILVDFDLSHIRVATNGEKVVCTPEFLAAYRHQVTQVNDEKFKMRRLLKIVGTGMQLASKKNVQDMVAFIKEKQKGCYIPEENEDPKEVVEQICSAYGLPAEQVTRDPEKCIHLIRTDSDIRTRAGYFDDAFFVEPRRFTNFDGLVVKQTGMRGYYTFKLIYPNLPQWYFEVRDIRLKNVNETDENGKKIGIECQILNNEDRDALNEFTGKVVAKVMDFVKDKPWIKMNHVFRNIGNIKFNAGGLNGTRVKENGKSIDREYFIRCFQGKVASRAIVAFNGVRCGYEATNGLVELYFQEITLNK